MVKYLPLQKLINRLKKVLQLLTSDLYSHRLYSHHFIFDPLVIFLDPLIDLACQVACICSLNIYKTNHTIVNHKEPMFKSNFTQKRPIEELKPTTV